MISATDNFKPVFLRMRATFPAVAAVLVATTAGWAFAAEGSSDGAALEARARAAEALAARPNDPQSIMRFAEASVAVGDAPAAIAALERLLALDPTLTNIRLELGLLYLRAGSPDLAALYLSEVVYAPETPEALRGRARDLLVEAERGRSRHVLTGGLEISSRFETNANAAPQSVLIAGAPADIVDPDEKPQDDLSVALGVDLRHVYDFGGQRGDTLETEIDLLGARYSEVESSDAAFARIASGPRFRLSPGADARPFLGASTLALEDARYRDTLFAGVEGAARLGGRSFFYLQSEVRLNDFIDSSANPLASRRSGEEARLRLAASTEVAPRTVATAAAFTGALWADAEFETNRWIGAELALGRSFANFVDPSLGRGSLQASASYAGFLYDEPNPVVDPGVTQRDRRVELRLFASVPVADSLSVKLGVDWVDNSSSLPNDEFDNFRVSFGVRHEFGATR